MKMLTREEARQEIRRSVNAADYLTKSKGENMFVCPFCHSGEGVHGTGALKLYPETNTWTCHACGQSGDVIDLYMLENGVDFLTAIDQLAEIAGINIEPGHNKPAQRAQEGAHSEIAHREHMTSPTAQKRTEAVTEDYSAYYERCTRSLFNSPEAMRYLSEVRGIRNTDLYTSFHLGYDAEWINPEVIRRQEAKGNTWRPEPSKRLIIPSGSGQYLARSIDPAVKDYTKQNVGKAAIFNVGALYEREVVFVVEGAIDALSIMEAGESAIALNSTSNAQRLLTALDDRPTAATLILCLDADEAGRKAEQTLRDGLRQLNIPFVSASLTSGGAGRTYKDPNEFLTADRGAFIAQVKATAQQKTEKPDNVSDYISLLMAGEIEKFCDASNIKTGYENLDEKTGGIYPGLYVVAAISSLGKTTFCHQMADQMAAAGNDVLFFSLEQSRLELVSKSLARKTAQEAAGTPVNALAIRRGYLPDEVLDAAESYQAAVADRLSIIEGNFNCTPAYIREYTKKYIDRTGKKPIVIIDYLQILQRDPKEHTSTKEAVDLTVTELKRMSRELNITLFCISSVNRSGYLTPIDFESLKESGGIEFTADVIWGLQLQCLNGEIFQNEKNNITAKRNEIKKAKAEMPRKIELVCLKNRYGISNFSCYFTYDPAHDYFKPQEVAEGQGDIIPDPEAPIYQKHRRN